MPKIRVASAKPNTGGRYNQGRKLGKARNHTHTFIEIEKPNRIITICSVPTCRALTVKRIISNGGVSQ